MMTEAKMTLKVTVAKCELCWFKLYIIQHNNKEIAAYVTSIIQYSLVGYSMNTAPTLVQYPDTNMT